MSDISANSQPERLIHVIQGDYAIAREDSSVLTAILGSCVAACICDPQARIGGMNHFLLPEARASSSEQVLYGARSMELLINALLKAGARKDRLEAKIFGGARMIAGLSDIGQGNGEFARSFLRNEGIPCLAESLGGTKARRIRFWPASGRAKQMLLGNVRSVEPMPPSTRPSPPNDVELF